MNNPEGDAKGIQSRRGRRVDEETGENILASVKSVTDGVVAACVVGRNASCETDSCDTWLGWPRDSRGSMSLSAADDGGDVSVFHWYTHAALQKRSDNFPES
ncbi:hypothetical protein F441_14947 [Phytophthora nicotianae CJ01A1]|uniref:Uncharacterized protein n=1 Tax=Phytophthora nicotianae CJ01A1 TaxID=1317063 RepID=W2WF98_PHYNI|nr:hypothetical protein F441_14947 [Phytophthora nicotianae CJ01A1]